MRLQPFSFFLSLFLLSFLTPALTLDNPALVTSISASVHEQGNVEALGGSMTYLEMNITVPQESAYQHFTLRERVVTDGEGNRLVNIRETNPANPYYYSVAADGSAHQRTTVLLPVNYSVPPEYALYLQPSQGVQSDDPAIIAVAREVTANCTSDWERVAKLTDYVNSIVAYDESLVGENKDAVWVLENRRGVCIEYSTLFIALARSVGIPARFVSGYAFSQYGNWLGHSWAEAYLGEWVPVDPTWLEAGHLDGTHIETFRGADSSAESSAVALMTPGAHLQFSPSESLGGETSAVDVTDIQSGRPIPFELEAGAEQLRFGDRTVLFAKLRGTDYRLVDATLVPCGAAPGEGAPVALQGDESLAAALEPGRDEYVVWVVEANPSLPEEFIYTCPIAAGSGYLEENEFTLTTTPEQFPRIDFTAWVGSSSVPLGGEQTVYYQVSSGIGGGKVGVVGEDVLRVFPASSGMDSFTYVPVRPGPNKIYAYASTGGVVELEFEVAAGSNAAILNVSAPGILVRGREANLSVLVRTGQVPGLISVTAGIGSASQAQQATFSGERALNFSITPQEAGMLNLTVVVEEGGRQEARTLPVRVIEQPDLTVSGTSFAFVGSGTTVVFVLTATGEPLNANVSIGGRKTPAQAGEISIESEPGEKTLVVEWADAAGNYYASSTQLHVPARGEATQTPAPTATPAPGQNPGCLGTILLLSSLSFAAACCRHKGF